MDPVALLDALEPAVVRLLAFTGTLGAFLVPAVFGFLREIIRKRRRDQAIADSGAADQRAADRADRERKARAAAEVRREVDGDPAASDELARWLRPGDGRR